MITKNMNGVIEEMTQEEYKAKIERGMKLEIVKEDFSKLKREELFAEAKKRGIKVKATVKNEELREKLNKA